MPPSLLLRGVPPRAAVFLRGVPPRAAVFLRGVPPRAAVFLRGVPPRAAVFLRGVPPRAPRLKAPSTRTRAKSCAIIAALDEISGLVAQLNSGSFNRLVLFLGNPAKDTLRWPRLWGTFCPRARTRASVLIPGSWTFGRVHPGRLDGGAPGAEVGPSHVRAVKDRERVWSPPSFPNVRNGDMSIEARMTSTGARKA